MRHVAPTVQILTERGRGHDHITLCSAALLNWKQTRGAGTCCGEGRCLLGPRSSRPPWPGAPRPAWPHGHPEGQPWADGAPRDTQSAGRHFPTILVALDVGVSPKNANCGDTSTVVPTRGHDG